MLVAIQCRVYAVPRFSNTEYLDMILIYGETDGNSRPVQQLYEERFLDKNMSNLQRYPDHGTDVCNEYEYTFGGWQCPDENINIGGDLRFCGRKFWTQQSRDCSQGWGNMLDGS